MNLKDNKQLWLFITVITFFITFLYINFTISKNSYLDEKSEELTRAYKLYLQSREEVATLLIEKIIEHQKTKELLVKLNKGVIKESSLKKSFESIYNLNFDYFKKKGFNSLHFHNKDGNSFLELEKTKKYSIHSKETTKSIKEINSNKKSIYGIEVNNSIQSLRFIYPLFYENNYIGSFEISSELHHLLAQLDNYIDSNFTFIWKKQFENINKKEFGESIKYKFQTEKEFSITKTNLFSQSIVYTFIPIKDINNDFIGYLTSKENNNEINHLLRTQLITFFSLLFLYICAIIAYRHLLKRHNENEKILEQYKYIIDKASIVSKATPEGIINYVNPQFCKISGYKEEELIGKSHNIIKHPESTDPFFKQMWKTISKKKVWQGLIKNRAKSGKDYYVQSTIAPILNDKNEILEFIAVREDITDLVNKKNMFKLEKERMTNLFNHVDEILIIKKDNIIEQISQKLFDTIAVSNLQEFNLQYNNISEMFLEKEAYLKAENDDILIKKVTQEPNKIHKVLIEDKNNELRTFWIKINKIPFSKTYYYLFTLIDITIFEEQNNTPLLNEKKENIENIKVEKDIKKTNLLEKAKEELKLPDEIIYSLVDKFLESSTKSVENLYKAIENKQENEAKIIAHNIKGSSSTLRLEEISSLAAQIEENISIILKTNKTDLIEKIQEHLDTLKKYREKL